jgi:hypothetical protein
MNFLDVYIFFSKENSTYKNQRKSENTLLKTIDKEIAEYKVVTRIKTDIKLSHERRDIFVYDKKNTLSC